MTSCEYLDDYIARRIDDRLAADFETHLNECVACRSEVEAWCVIDDDLMDLVAADLSNRQPTESNARSLMARFTEESAAERSGASGFATRRKLVRWAFAAAALVVVSSSLLIWRLHEPDRVEGYASTPIPASASIFVGGERRDLSFPELVGIKLDVAANERMLLRIGEDRIGLGPAGGLRVLEHSPEVTALRLERGAVACAVARRGPDQRFEVLIGSFAVRVIGTRFAIERLANAELRVTVIEGAVAVTGGGGRWNIGAGQRLRVGDRGAVDVEPLTSADSALLEGLLGETIDDNAALDPNRVEPESRGAAESGQEPDTGSRSNLTGPSRKTHKENPLAQWRGWIAQGRPADAEAALLDYLESNPVDYEGWWLLAGCQRKAGKWSQAILSYERVVEIGPASLANGARFKAGAILQDHLGDQSRAIDLFTEYLTAPSHRSLEVEAMLRMARSLRESGNIARAGQMLEEIVEKHGGTPGAIRAGKLLKEMGRP